MTKVIYTTLEEDKINFSSKTKEQLFELYNSISEVIAIKLFHQYKYNKGIELEDIKQLANISLWKAIDKYDIEKNIKFCTFAFNKVKFLVQDDLRSITKSRSGYTIYENTQLSLFSTINDSIDRVNKTTQLCDILQDNRNYSSKEQDIINNINKILAHSNFSEKDKNIFIEAIIDNIPQNKIAKKYGISTANISQRVNKVKRYLQQYKNQII